MVFKFPAIPDSSFRVMLPEQADNNKKTEHILIEHCTFDLASEISIVFSVSLNYAIIY